MPRAARRLGFALCCSAAVLCAPGATAQILPDAARAQVLTLGPWPPPWRPDPGNRVSGRPLAVELGRLLFSDPRMSPVGYIACVACHQPDRAFTDGKARAHGLADLPRNTPALANLRLQRSYGWDGASDRLWLASIRPIVDPREFDGSAASVTKLFAREPGLAACYRAVFGVSPLAQPQRTLLNVGKALAAFVETLVTERTPFDDFRDALERRDEAGAASYSAAARRGLSWFVGPAGCVASHGGPNFSDGGAGGPYRTPSLRNVAVTAPYLHDGRAGTLREAVQHALPARELGDDPLDDLVAFLQTLTDRHAERRPWRPSSEAARCP